jgi:hypothetical protein
MGAALDRADIRLNIRINIYIYGIISVGFNANRSTTDQIGSFAIVRYWRKMGV